ncbi:MAG: hypothetical protein AABX28_00010 [Nanoarchaeota archaeon]
MKNSETKKISVWLLALFYLFAVIFFISGIVDIFFIRSIPLSLLFVVLYIGIAVLLFVTTNNLRKGKNWAILSAKIILGVGILFALSFFVRGRIVTGLIYLILFGLAGWYLFFKKFTQR